jgi:ribosomal protein L44E
MKRNPRRAYDKDGGEIQPATVGSERAKGFTKAEIWCNPCTRFVEVSLDGLPDDLPVPDICLRYRCSKCGGKSLTSRGSIREHYEKLDEQRKARS